MLEINRETSRLAGSRPENSPRSRGTRPDRARTRNLRNRATATQTQLEAAKIRVKQIESERKRLDLEVEAKKTQIEKYANQQLQTRKNEEYKALAHEIEMAKEDDLQNRRLRKSF